MSQLHGGEQCNAVQCVCVFHSQYEDVRLVLLGLRFHYISSPPLPAKWQTTYKSNTMFYSYKCLFYLPGSHCFSISFIIWALFEFEFKFNLFLKFCQHSPVIQDDRRKLWSHDVPLSNSWHDYNTIVLSIVLVCLHGFYVHFLLLYRKVTEYKGRRIKLKAILYFHNSCWGTLPGFHRSCLISLS